MQVKNASLRDAITILYSRADDYEIMVIEKVTGWHFAVTPEIFRNTLVNMMAEGFMVYEINLNFVDMHKLCYVEFVPIINR